jgi:hypothetical protein
MMVDDPDAWLYRPDMREKPRRDQEPSRRARSMLAVISGCVFVMILLYGWMSGMVRALAEHRSNEAIGALVFVVVCLAVLAWLAKAAKARGK